MGGRPKLMEPKHVAAARALLTDGSRTSKEVAAHFNVLKATFYQHLGAEPSLRMS